VLVLTPPEVIDVRALDTVAEITSSIRGIAAEVGLDDLPVGLDGPSAINCDGLHTIMRTSLTTYAGSVSDDTMDHICAAVAYALGCRATREDQASGAAAEGSTV
jgi:mRNA-degrading endonuclease toxin of MazEF toxin-antitoxin module